MDPIEMAGYWFIPEAPTDRVAGTLRYSREEGFRLHLPLGHLGSTKQFIERFNQENSVDLPCIQGDLQNGKKITLVDCMQTRATINMPGINSEEYHSLLGFYGDYHPGTDPLVKQVEVTYPHLRDWVRHNPAWLQVISEGKSFETFAYHYEVPDDCTICIGDGWRLTLKHTHSAGTPTVKGFTLTHDCKLLLELDNPMAFAEVEDQYLDLIRLFLSFCMNESLYETKVRVRLASEDGWLDVGRMADTSTTSSDTVPKATIRKRQIRPTWEAPPLPETIFLRNALRRVVSCRVKRWRSCGLLGSTTTGPAERA